MASSTGPQRVQLVSPEAQPTGLPRLELMASAISIVTGNDHVVCVGGVKPRALLAILALHANEQVSADRLAP